MNYRETQNSGFVLNNICLPPQPTLPDRVFARPEDEDSGKFHIFHKKKKNGGEPVYSNL